MLTPHSKQVKNMMTSLLCLLPLLLLLILTACPMKKFQAALPYIGADSETSWEQQVKNSLTVPRLVLD